MSRTRKYYLLVIIGSAILLFLVFIATIVYILAVNPTAQASGSVFYNQIYMLCSQFYTPTNTGLYVNQYLYHYCVVEPQEAIAIVLGFLIVVAFAIIIFFAVKTRNKINYYGKQNILWDNTKSYDEAPNVEEWVRNPEVKTHRIPEPTAPLKHSQYGNTTNYNGSAKDQMQKRRAGKPKRTNTDNYDGDYTTGGESCDELEEDWDREYPPVSSDQQRQTYKRDFDAGLQEYKRLQAELDEISKELSRLDKELDNYVEDSEEYRAAADEYNRLKDIKASADYKNRKAYCKMLKSKLSHIKRMVTEYDRQKS
ncbi:hypothetical protein JD844_008714 [Phrynosoma platyrhinos]|uniref:Occludin n=1 Tax=Phrynosoma platyrhinos TaxID=52577 RepID=A0ABQ7TEF6_PHRPL|nr:hypothetical protein JD844_008714 [Phrynosoma platyrhinos]